MQEKTPDRIDRRRFLKVAGLAGLGLAGLDLVGCATPAAPPTPTAAPKAATPAPKTETREEQEAKLLEAAKKEGRVSLYDALLTEDLERLAKAVQKTYPFLEFDFYRSTSEEVIEKVLTEHKGGRYQADAVHINAYNLLPLLDQGLTMKYRSPAEEGLPKDAYDPEGAWHYSDHMLFVIGYNTNLIPAAQAPKSYEDLADPRFKGKLGIESEAVEWFTITKDIMGETKFLDVARKIAANNPRPIKGFGTVAGMLVSGEVPVAITLYQHRAQLDQDKKAPVEWLFGTDPPPTSANYFLIMKNAPHPNAAKLLLDWFLSKEGQEEIVVKGVRRFPVRPGVEVPARLKDVRPKNPPLETLRRINQSVAEFRQVFNIR